MLLKHTEKDEKYPDNAYSNEKSIGRINFRVIILLFEVNECTLKEK